MSRIRGVKRIRWPTLAAHAPLDVGDISGHHYEARSLVVDANV